MAASALQDTETDAADADITAGELLVDMASYWKEALPEERRDIVCTLLSLNGLIYELERSTIVGRTPRTDILRVLTLGLTQRWEQRVNGLWLLDAFLPPKREQANPHAPLPMQFKLDPLQRQRARELAQTDMTVRQLADHFGVLRMAICRALHAESNGHDR